MAAFLDLFAFNCIVLAVRTLSDSTKKQKKTALPPSLRSFPQQRRLFITAAIRNQEAGAGINSTSIT